MGQVAYLQWILSTHFYGLPLPLHIGLHKNGIPVYRETYCQTITPHSIVVIKLVSDFVHFGEVADLVMSPQIPIPHVTTSISALAVIKPVPSYIKNYHSIPFIAPSPTALPYPPLTTSPIADPVHILCTTLTTSPKTLDSPAKTTWNCNSVFLCGQGSAKIQVQANSERTKRRFKMSKTKKRVAQLLQ